MSSGIISGDLEAFYQVAISALVLNEEAPLYNGGRDLEPNGQFAVALKEDFDPADAIVHIRADCFDLLRYGQRVRS